jgi:thiosulfate/3-mercaptopyruvate sulfurtransferase
VPGPGFPEPDAKNIFSKERYMKKTLFVTALVLFSAFSLFAKGGSETKAPTADADPVDTKTVFVSPEWVNSVINNKQKESGNYIVLEANWGSAAESPDYNKGHVPGAIHVDIASIEEEPDWNLKSARDVEKSLLDLGITKDTTVILYGADVSGTARIAYAYLWAGVENVKILDGAIDAYKKAGFQLETKANNPTAVRDFKALVPVHPEYWISIDDAQKKLKTDPNFKLVSIRSYKEFCGETSGYSYIDKAGEPKGAVWGKAGSDPYHMEDYINDDNTYINLDQLKALWSDVDFTLDNELAFYCGTGWRATIPFLIMYQNGYTNMELYDGGWFQWHMRPEFEVQVGAPNKPGLVYTTVERLPNDKAAK